MQATLWKLRKAMAADQQVIYSVAKTVEAEMRLAELETKWSTDLPVMVQSWQRNWACIIPFFDYPPNIRRIIYHDQHH
jgi:putative transposase